MGRRASATQGPRCHRACQEWSHLEAAMLGQRMLVVPRGGAFGGGARCSVPSGRYPGQSVKLASTISSSSAAPRVGVPLAVSGKSTTTPTQCNCTGLSSALHSAGCLPKVQRDDPPVGDQEPPTCRRHCTGFANARSSCSPASVQHLQHVATSPASHPPTGGSSL